MLVNTSPVQCQAKEAPYKEQALGAAHLSKS